MRFELKNYRGVIFHNIEEWCKVSRKTNSWFQKWHEELVEFSHNHSNVWKFHFNGLFSYEVWTKKKCGGVIFHDTEQWRKIWINPDLVVSKVARGIGWTFIRALKSLKNCTMIGSFCPKNIMFHLENFRVIMCHDTEGWWKI